MHMAQTSARRFIRAEMKTRNPFLLGETSTGYVKKISLRHAPLFFTRTRFVFHVAKSKKEEGNIKLSRIIRPSFPRILYFCLPFFFFFFFAFFVRLLYKFIRLCLKANMTKQNEFKGS